MHKILTVALLAAVAGWFASEAFTEDPAGPTEAEVMEEMMKLGTPGAPHALLGKLAGDFDVAVTMHMEAGPMEGAATSKQTVIHGGRYLQIDYTSEFGGMPFQGLGLLGYDNFKKVYQNFWCDSFSTGMNTSEGTCSEDGKVITLTSEMPSKWGTFHGRSIYTIESADRFTLEMHSRIGEGPERKEMVLVFNRKSKK